MWGIEFIRSVFMFGMHCSPASSAFGYIFSWLFAPSSLSLRAHTKYTHEHLWLDYLLIRIFYPSSLVAFSLWLCVVRLLCHLEWNALCSRAAYIISLSKTQNHRWQWQHGKLKRKNLVVAIYMLKRCKANERILHILYRQCLLSKWSIPIHLKEIHFTFSDGNSKMMNHVVWIEIEWEMVKNIPHLFTLQPKRRFSSIRRDLIGLIILSGLCE